MTRIDSRSVPPLIWPPRLESDLQLARNRVHCSEHVASSGSDECTSVLDFVELHCLSRVPLFALAVVI